MTNSICQALRIEARSMWTYLVFLANRLLVIVSILSIAVDIVMEGGPIPPEVYGLLILCSIAMGWYEMREKQIDKGDSDVQVTRRSQAIERSESTRMGFLLSGGALKLRNARFTNLDVAVDATDTDINVEDVEIK